jgi:hypothetical protein
MKKSNQKGDDKKMQMQHFEPTGELVPMSTLNDLLTTGKIKCKRCEEPIGGYVTRMPESDEPLVEADRFVCLFCGWDNVNNVQTDRHLSSEAKKWRENRQNRIRR